MVNGGHEVQQVENKERSGFNGRQHGRRCGKGKDCTNLEDEKQRKVHVSVQVPFLTGMRSIGETRTFLAAEVYLCTPACVFVS